MDFFSNLDKTIDGLKRGAAKFGGKSAEKNVKRMEKRVNGIAPTESEPYGLGEGGAETEQSSPSQAENSGGKTTSDGKTLDQLSKEITGKPYRSLPDDGAEQDHVMHEFEKQGGVAQQAFDNASAGKCLCGQPKRDQDHPDYHTPGSDRCKQIADRMDNSYGDNPWEKMGGDKLREVLRSMGLKDAADLSYRYWKDVPEGVKIAFQDYMKRNNSVENASGVRVEGNGNVFSTTVKGKDGKTDKFLGQVESDTRQKDSFHATASGSGVAKIFDSRAQAIEYLASLNNSMDNADRPITQDDMNASARGNNMLGMSVADLRDLISSMEGKDMFAAKVTVAAAKQMLAAKKRMGAAENSSGESAFVDYCMMFYGPGEIHGDFFKHKLKRSDVEKAVKTRLARKDPPFDGDSVDRELVRDILLSQKNWAAENSFEDSSLMKAARAKVEEAKAKEKAAGGRKDGSPESNAVIAALKELSEVQKSEMKTNSGDPKCPACGGKTTIDARRWARYRATGDTRPAPPYCASCDTFWKADSFKNEDSSALGYQSSQKSTTAERSDYLNAMTPGQMETLEKLAKQIYGKSYRDLDANLEAQDDLIRRVSGDYKGVKNTRNNAEPAKDKNGANGYIVYWEKTHKSYEVYADSSYGACKKLADQEGSKKGTVGMDATLAEKGGSQVTHVPSNSNANDSEMKSKCLACGHESPSEWSGKCESCLVENASDVGGNLSHKPEHLDNGSEHEICQDCVRYVEGIVGNGKALPGFFTLDTKSDGRRHAWTKGSGGHGMAACGKVSLDNEKQNAVPVPCATCGKESGLGYKPSDGAQALCESCWDKHAADMGARADAAEARKGRKNAGPGGFDYKRVDTSTLKGLEEAEKLKEAGWKIISSGLYSILFEKERGSRNNAGHLTPDAWEAGDLNERAAWLDSSSQDINLAPRGWNDLSSDVHLALQDVKDLPESMNNSTVEDCGSCGHSWDSHSAYACKDCAGDKKNHKFVDQTFDRGLSNEGDMPDLKNDNLEDLVRQAKTEFSKIDRIPFTFVDLTNSRETVEATSLDHAWEVLANSLDASVEELKEAGVEVENADKYPLPCGPVQHGGVVGSCSKELDGKLCPFCEMHKAELGKQWSGTYKENTADAMLYFCPRCSEPTATLHLDESADCSKCSWSAEKTQGLKKVPPEQLHQWRESLKHEDPAGDLDEKGLGNSSKGEAFDKHVESCSTCAKASAAGNYGFCAKGDDLYQAKYHEFDNGNSVKVTQNGSEYEVETIDPTHVKLKLVGSDQSGFALHVQQLQPEMVQQLQGKGAMDSRKYMLNAIETFPLKNSGVARGSSKYGTKK